MNAPRPFERRRGELVMRTMGQRKRAEEFAWGVANLLGREVVVHTRKGQRRHAGIVVAVYDPEAHERWPLRRVVSNPRISAPPDWERRWASALARERYLNAPRGHRIGHGRLVVRIEQSTSPNMVGRHIHVGRHF